MVQVSGTGYNDQGEVHLLKSFSSEQAKQAIYNLLEVSVNTLLLLKGLKYTSPVAIVIIKNV